MHGVINDAGITSPSRCPKFHLAHCDIDLDAPVMRVASIDTPIPFSRALEDQFLPKGRLKAALEKLAAW